MLASILIAALAGPIIYQGQILYPYFCSKTWVCDYVPEAVYREHCQKRPCTTVKDPRK